MSYEYENEIELDPKISNILTNIKIKIDELGIVFSTIREHILQLAKYLDEEKKCQRDRISVLIKNLLAEKVKEAKISARWIEGCLPKEYKRKYAKSELTSHSVIRTNPSSPDQYLVQEFEGNESVNESHDVVLDKKYDSNCINDEEDILQENVELKEALLKTTKFHNALNQEHRFEVSKYKLAEIIGWLKKCEEICYLIFDYQGTLVRIEADNVKSENDSEQ